MTTTYLTLSTLDPIVARDGRPFGEGQGGRMKSLRWPTPSVAAGSLRTAVVKADPCLSFEGDMPARLQQLAVAGPFPALGDELYLPAPADAVFDGHRLRRRRPIRLPPGAGTDLPPGLLPLDIADRPAEAFKPKPIPAWWPVGRFARWLTDPAAVTLDDSFLLDPDIETRDHVKLDPDRGAASDGDLFSTSALHLSRLPRSGGGRSAEISLAVRIRDDDNRFEGAARLDTLHPLGGERRLAHWRADASAAGHWDPPGAITAALRDATHVLMTLATAAIFAHGWRPGWLSDDLTGSPPGSDVRLRLVAAAVDRWAAISGFSLSEPRGPKPVRRTAPAGSVYFFTVESGSAASLADLWLQSVCDNDQDRRDGFGLATWGHWNN